VELPPEPAGWAPPPATETATVEDTVENTNVFDVYPPPPPVVAPPPPQHSTRTCEPAKGFTHVNGLALVPEPVKVCTLDWNELGAATSPAPDPEKMAPDMVAAL
jgi:hypothetical protein